MINETTKAMNFYTDERSASRLYAYLAGSEKNPALRARFAELARVETLHMAFWRAFLLKRGIATAEPSWFSFAWSRLLRQLLGTRRYLSLLEITEATAVDSYYQFLNFATLEEAEKTNIARIIEDELGHEEELESQFNALPKDNVRDFVMGMNDGLVELLGAVTGLSAVYPTRPQIVAVNGLVVGLAGALSMGIGTWVSVRSQRQVNEGIRRKTDLLFSVAPKRAQAELARKLTESGMPADLTDEITEKLASNKEAMIGLLTEHTRVNEIRSALFTGVAYIIGLLFPVLPYFFARNSFMALIFSVLFAGLALAIVASIITLTAGSNAFRHKIREMVITGLGAAAASYAFGRLVQAVFGIHA
ncbi:rubrerythrin family protein [Candidatus Cryosericum odellii]|jgi:VIT1/CCC1 family predicted Fe2+/Mn2+ transporter|uniref:Rubrerythrin family protein n=2 Tax=Candidatus Cryosericum odellii TaxID=2290917 RepID=A0A398CXP9_9BACT|nr:VIT1/CCC1 transporter family protein [Candidatus Cryosericum odellii]RIE07445.1 rubrerythrin family protein [Candidatus Cryosericum odellii]